MSYTLIVGDYAYSSWSLRGWLLFDRFGIPMSVRRVAFSEAEVSAQLADVAPARTVPTVVTDAGTPIWDSLAIAEELASRHPDAALWPADAEARATARTLAAEMHAGFAALRSECPMNLRCAYIDFAPSDAVLHDLARLEAIWAHARARCGHDGPWLCGRYSVADAFFAPVVGRIAGYGLPVGQAAADYVQAHLADPAFRRWRSMGLVHGPDLQRYARDLATGAWPGPEPIPARAIGEGPSVNTACPYSGNPVAHFLDSGGRIYGFCNAFCRDKTATDPEAWPAFMKIYQS